MTLTIGIIGAGRVGTTLGAALLHAGHRVVAASGSSDVSRHRIATLLPTARVLTPREVAASAVNLLIISVPDDALAGVVEELADAHAVHPGQIVAHTSGAHGLAVLAPLTVLGARPLALHPAMTFTGGTADLERLSAGISFGVTAAPELAPIADVLVTDLGGEVEWVHEAARPLYHAALAHGANHLVTLVNEAADRLRDSGVVQPEKVLAPLLRAALENSLALGDAALTGPVSRGDAGTVAKHVTALGAVAPDSVPTYLALARRTADRAIAVGRLRPTDAESLLDVLAGHPETVPPIGSVGQEANA